MTVCAACGRENPPDARFCNGCGGAVAAGPAPRQQRKTVTVLFCDVAGSTARLEQAAAPGEVVIGPQTWRLVRGAVTAEPLDRCW